MKMLFSVFSTICLLQAWAANAHEPGVDESSSESALELEAAKIWGQVPSCDEGSSPDRYCIYSSGLYDKGRGISILTTHHLATNHFAKLQPLAKPQPFSHLTNLSSVPWEVRKIEGKGRGIFATRPIKRGELILTEPAVLIFHEEGLKNDNLIFYARAKVAIEQLPEPTRKLIYDMAGQEMNLGVHNIGKPMHSVMGKVFTNVFAIGYEKTQHLAVFPHTARLNHDCRPNSVYIPHPETLTQTVIASQPIALGEEITITYIDPSDPIASRHHQLRSHYGFNCTCALCSSSPAAIVASDARVSAIADLQDKLSADWTPNSIGTPEMAEQLIKLLLEEGWTQFVGTGYWITGLSYCAAGNAEKAMAYVTKAVESMIEVPEDGLELGDAQSFLKVGPQHHWCWKLRVAGSDGDQQELMADQTGDADAKTSESAGSTVGDYPPLKSDKEAVNNTSGIVADPVVENVKMKAPGKDMSEETHDEL